jgi:tryptophanyl-tRNA synthetase
MSKSKGNTIDLFLSDKALRKQIMAIQTDSTPLEAPKNPDTCNVFAIYKLIASNEQTAEMKANYERGGFGYGHAKQELFELMVDKFEEPRRKFMDYMSNPQLVDRALVLGAERAEAVAQSVLKRVRSRLGY